jgi:DNA polymerase-3 subunit alpha
MPKPLPPASEPWSTLERLNKERELVGIYLSAHPLDDFRVEIENCTNMSIGDLDDLRVHEGKEVRIAGMVAAVEHRMTKTGKPMGSLTVEDYQGTLKMMFFSADYNKFKEFMTQGSTLFIKGKVQPRPFGDTKELEFKVESIMYLDDVKDKLLSTVALKIPISFLNEKLIYEINSCVEKHKGSAELKFLIYDPENEKNNVFMTSKAHKVRISNELMNSLSLIAEIENVKIFPRTN